MNCVEIMGGLGNQLFQYVFARYLQKKSLLNTVVTTDYYKRIGQNGNTDTSREFLLDKYNTTYINVEGTVPYKYFCNDALYSESILGIDNIFFQGYWQDIKFYNEVKDEIRKEIILKQEYIDASMEEIGARMQACNSVAVHVRRTDYLNQINSSIFEQLTLDYYRQAVSTIKLQTKEEPLLFIFSDDSRFVSENMSNFERCQTVIMQLREPYKDLYLMTKARHNIIANSTFGWWGAALNTYSQNITVAPSKWLKKEERNMYLDDWIIL